MTQTKRAATRKGGGSRAAEAAAAESNGKVRTMDYHGFTLEMPSKLPRSFSFRFGRLTDMEEREQLASGELYRLVEKTIGGPAQYAALCDYIDGLDEDAADADEIGLVGFLVACIEFYGNDPGESSASTGS